MKQMKWIGSSRRSFWQMFMLCLLLCGSTACSLPGSRPQNLRGHVQCVVVPHDATTSLLVRVVLDEAAIRQHSRFEVIREVFPSATEEAGHARLMVDIGSAMGAINSCFTFEDTAFQVDITDQMISYPSWIRITSRPDSDVLLIIEDTNGQPVVTPSVLPPTPNRFTVAWLR